jgi:hypothetical protein
MKNIEKCTPNFKAAAQSRARKRFYTMSVKMNKVAPNPKRPKNLPQKSAEHFSGQDSAWQPKVFVKTFG